MKWKWMLPIGAAGISLVIWIAFAIALAMHVKRSILMTIVVVGAFSVEAVIWTTAAALGVSAFQARREIWRRLRATFQRT